MATWRPELHTIEEVVGYYDQWDFPAYKVFAGNSPKMEYCRFTYDGNDKGIGREKLLEALHSVASNFENTNTYIIQILKPKGKTFEPYNQITFQLNKPNNIFPATVGAYNIPQNNQVNNEILSRLRGLEEKLNQLEDEEDEEEEEPEEENILSGILSNPQMKQMLVGIVSSIFNGNNKPKAMAGIPTETETTPDIEEQKIQSAIEVLKNNTPNLGDKLLKLAEMSINDPNQYKFLVKML